MCSYHDQAEMTVVVTLARKSHKHVFVFRKGLGKRWEQMSERESQPVCEKVPGWKIASGKGIIIELHAILLCQKAYDCSNPQTSLALNLY